MSRAGEAAAMAGGIRRKKNNPAKKRDKRLGPIQYDAEGKMIDDRNTEAGAKLKAKDYRCPQIAALPVYPAS